MPADDTAYYCATPTWQIGVHSSRLYHNNGTQRQPKNSFKQ